MNEYHDAAAHVNPNRATTIGNLVRPSQLYWIARAAESVGVDKEEQSELMFNCSLYELNERAAETLLIYLARVKANCAAPNSHEHDCAVCGDTFTCDQSLCNSDLSRYCDNCAEITLGTLLSDIKLHAAVSSIVRPQSCVIASARSTQSSPLLAESHPRSKGRIGGVGI